jgi:hypothetical protein
VTSQPEPVKFPLPPSPVPDPNRLAVLREPKAHVAFGAGTHQIEFREGHLLARMRELPVTWDAP